MTEPSAEGPDRTSKDFTLADLESARREGREQGIKDTLVLIDAGGTTAFIRERLLDRVEEQS